jgi:hypothetical protein
MDLGEIGWSGMDCIGLAQDRDRWKAVVNTVMNLLTRLNVEKFLSSCTTVGLSNSAQLHRVIIIKILGIIHRPVDYLQLNSVRLSVPHWKHITSPLGAQQVNAICRFVTTVH